MPATEQYASIQGNSRGFRFLAAVLSVALLAGFWAAHSMESLGHHVTGMTNQIVWGLPHVFAVFLIVAASGALNVASIASVFGKTAYRPLSRLSTLAALALLLGGLAILVLDLGRPDRLMVAMTYYNFKSIFAWNVFLYVGFVVIAIVYLWLLMQRGAEHLRTPLAYVALIWRLVLTTGTGSIFGFLVARQAYDAAVMAPLFVAMSFSLGLASFVLMLTTVCHSTGRPLSDQLLRRLGRLQMIFVLASLYFVCVFLATNWYASEHRDVVLFLVRDGSPYSSMFWYGQIAAGSVLPFLLLRFSAAHTSRLITSAIASVLVIVGGLAQLYIIIIGGQAYPLILFPGKIESSSFFDGSISSYTPSAYEILLGVGGIALAITTIVVMVRLFPVIPTRLDENPRADG